VSYALKEVPLGYATLVKVPDPFHPLKGREIVPLMAAGPFSACAPKTEQPFIILRNGEAVLRADWCQMVSEGDLIAVVLLPQGGGGGGSNPLKIVLMLAVSIFAPYVATTFLGAGGLVSGAIGLAANALVSAIIPTPKANSSSQVSSIAAASPTYNLAAQGNSARLEAAIPVHYGRLQVFPDFAAMPYIEYYGNEQYLYQLLCIGCGEYDIEAIRIEDTPLSNFNEITTEIVPPGGALTLFPANVTTSIEVSGQEALTATWIGPFVASAPETRCNAIGVDIVLPRGLYYANDDGGLSSVSATFTVQARQIDDYGVAIGSWVTLDTQTITKATTTPQRFSFRYAVGFGRYEVRLQRTDTKQTDTRYGHELDWSGLRCYMPETRDFGNVTLLAMRMRASNNLSAQASRKINVIATRKLKTWNPESGWSAVSVPTRSIAWAAVDAAKNADYGGGLPDARIDLPGLYALDQLWEARNNHFDGRFDSAITLWEGLSQIVKVGRAKPYMQGGIVYVARDEAKTLPVAMFTMRNIVRGSFSLDFVLPSDDTADCVTTAYFDETVWATRRVPSALPGSTSAKPFKMDLFGAINRQHVHEEGMYYAACNQYRRTPISFETEMEGFILSFLDLISVSHDMPQWGQAGEVVAWDTDTRTAILSEPLTWGSGTHYIGLRRRDGSMAGPFVATAGTDAYHVVLEALDESHIDHDFTPYTGYDEERTHYTFGWGDTWCQLARVTSVKPRGINRVAIEAINEDSSVHTADRGVVAPPITSSQLPTRNTAPVVLGFTARSMPHDSDKMLLSWNPSPGADYYLLEQSKDGESWVRMGEPTACNFAATALYGPETIVRIAAVGMVRGPWIQCAYGISADYMWTISTNAMWSVDSNMMWRY